MMERIREKSQARGFRYSNLQRLGIELYRRFVPSVDSPYTLGPVEDICAVHLVDPEKMQASFTGYLKRLQALKGKDVGDYLEFGVFNGTSLSNMRFAAEKLGIETMRLFGFDAFQGLPPESEKEDDGTWKAGFYTCSFEQLQECLKRKGIDPEGVHWVKGWYKDTLTPATAKEHALDDLDVVFIDCDTYSSSKSALDFIAPLIKRPVIICLDDWRLYDVDLKGGGEYQSFNEFLESNPHLRAEEIESYKRNARVFLVQPA